MKENITNYIFSHEQIWFSLRSSGRRVESNFIPFGTRPHERQRDACAAGRGKGAHKKMLGNGSAGKLYETIRRGKN